MKKIMTLLLTLALVLALCACGQGGTIAPAQDSQEPDAAPAEEPAEEPASEEPAEEPAAEEPAEEPTEEPAEEPAEETEDEAVEEPTEEPAEETEEDDLPRGTITETETGVHYENSFLGFACDLDENWYVYSEEEMAQTAGITAEKFEGTDYEEILKNTPVFYDFFAARIDGLATINVNFSYAGPTAGLLNMDQYLEAMIPQMVSMVEASGMTDVSIEKNSVTFAGSERTGLLIHAKTQGIDYYAQQIYTVVGPRISTLTMGSFLEDNTADLMTLFQPIG